MGGSLPRSVLVLPTKSTVSNHICLITGEGGNILASNLQLVYSLTNNNSREQYHSMDILLYLIIFSKLK